MSNATEIGFYTCDGQARYYATINGKRVERFSLKALRALIGGAK